MWKLDQSLPPAARRRRERKRRTPWWPQTELKKEGANKEAANSSATKTYSGKCLCGAVTFRAEGLSDIWYCHCQQCQHLTGHYIAAAGVQRNALTIKGDVDWRAISSRSKSGHCASCGCYMFWDMASKPTVSVLAGNLDDTAGLEVKGHIYVSEKPDYYEITDGLAQFETYPSGALRD